MNSISNDPTVKFLARGDRVELDLVEQSELLKTILDKRERESRSIDRRICNLQQKRQRADVVFVRVGQNNADQFVAMLFDIAEVGNRDVGAEQVFIGKHHPAIDDDHLIAVTKHGHVHSELTKPPKRCDL